MFWCLVNVSIWKYTQLEDQSRSTSLADITWGKKSNWPLKVSTCTVTLAYITGFFHKFTSTFTYIISLFDRTVGEHISEVLVMRLIHTSSLFLLFQGLAPAVTSPAFPTSVLPLHAHWVLPFSAHTFLPSWRLSGPPLHPLVTAGFLSASPPLHHSTNTACKVTDDLHVAKSESILSQFILQHLTQLITLFSLCSNFSCPSPPIPHFPSITQAVPLWYFCWYCLGQSLDFPLFFESILTSLIISSSLYRL